MEIVNIAKLMECGLIFSDDKFQVNNKKLLIETPYITINKDGRYGGYRCFDNKICDSLKKIDEVLKNVRVKNDIVREFKNKKGTMSSVVSLKISPQMSKEEVSELENVKDNEYKLMIEPFFSQKYKTVSLMVVRLKAKEKSDRESTYLTYEFEKDD